MEDAFLTILYEMKESFGLEVFENSRRTNSILLDLAPEMKKERIQIVNIINAGGYRFFRDNHLSYELVYYKLMDVLKDEYGIQQEIAHWAIGTFSKLFYDETILDAQDVYRQSVAEKFENNLHLNRIATGCRHTVVLKNNGKVVAVGDNSHGQCDVEAWRNVKAVFAKADITICLTNKKEMFVTGDIKQNTKNFKKVEKVYFDELIYGISTSGEILVPDKAKEMKTKFDFENFYDLEGIAVGGSHILGLKNTGKVIAAGSNEKGQINVHAWRNITSVAAGYWFSVGLMSNGTVVACGSNLRGQCEVSSWRNILAIYTTGDRTVGLRRDGTVVAAGNNKFGQCNVEKWRNIISISVSDDHTVGLSAEGLVYATGRNDYYQCNTSCFQRIVAVAAGDSHTIGLVDDGTLVEVGANESGQCDIEGICL